MEVIKNSLVGYSMDEFPAALDAMERATPAGQWCNIMIGCKDMPSKDACDLAWAQVTITGHHMTKPVTSMVNGVPFVSFNIKRDVPYKQFQWQIIIPLIVPILTVFLVGFGITKISSISSAVVPIILIAVGGIVLIAVALRKPAEKFVESGGANKLIGAKMLAHTYNSPNDEDFKRSGVIWDATERLEKERILIHNGLSPSEAGLKWNELKQDRRNELAIYFLNETNLIKIRPFFGATILYATIMSTGDTTLTEGSVINLETIRKENERVAATGGNKATYHIVPVGAISDNESGGKNFPGGLGINWEAETKDMPEVAKDLTQSVMDERKAVMDYVVRADKAESDGYPDIAAKYQEIINDEIDHGVIFSGLLKKFPGNAFMADSPEYLAETIERDGWREKIEDAFTSRMEVIKKD